MGKVLELDTTAKRSRKPKVTPLPSRKGRSKTALVLGGGGLTGAVYEIGALRAYDLLSVNHTVNQFDIYVGTSAGSFLTPLAANGVTPEEMMRVVDQQAPSPIKSIDLKMLLRPNMDEILSKFLLTLPLRTAVTVKNMASQIGHVSIVDLIAEAANSMPSGFYTGTGIESYMQTVLSDPDRTNDFRELEKELYIVATDLDNCERIVFGSEGWDDVPISKAVQASTALPTVYEPVEVRNRELVDGAILSTTNLDVAVEAGAEFIVVINPLVPYLNTREKRVPTLFGSRLQRVSDMGFAQILNQSFKLVAHRRLHEMAKHWKEKYPGVDIVLIEPDQDDDLMFHTSVMNFTQRVAIARHGFESVTVNLSNQYEHYKEICHRHGIEISAERVRQVVKHFEQEHGKTGAWQRILEQTASTLLRQSAS